MTICLSCDDMPRPTPADAILPMIFEQLYQAGVEDSSIKIVVATGSHRAMTEDELEAKFGKEICSKTKIINHDCKDVANLVSYDVADKKFDILVNKVKLFRKRSVICRQRGILYVRKRVNGIFRFL